MLPAHIRHSSPTVMRRLWEFSLHVPTSICSDVSLHQHCSVCAFASVLDGVGRSSQCTLHDCEQTDDFRARQCSLLSEYDDGGGERGRGSSNEKVKPPKRPVALDKGATAAAASINFGFFNYGCFFWGGEVIKIIIWPPLDVCRQWRCARCTFEM